MLSSIMQNISSSLCTTILELLLPGAAESSASVTNWLTKSDTAQDLWISVFMSEYSPAPVGKYILIIYM
jgi:hypothetical protein